MVRSSVCVLALLCAAAVVAAQTPAQQPPAAPQPKTQQPAQQPPAPPPQPAQANKVTYTGCLKPGATAESWTLENADMASAASATAKPGEGTVGTSGTAGSKTIFNLSAKAGENLKPHTNHKIEVVGTVSQASPSGAASGATSTPRQTLNVESFKMVSATCP